MKRQIAAVLFAGAFVAATGAAVPHHSFAMFDSEHPMDMDGIVQEFKFTSPHTFILLKVKDKEGDVTWSLEGASPSALVRDGWSSKSLKSGDELTMKIDPLRSGAPGGAWAVKNIKFKDGKPVVVSH